MRVEASTGMPPTRAKNQRTIGFLLNSDFMMGRTRRPLATIWVTVATTSAIDV